MIADVYNEQNQPRISQIPQESILGVRRIRG